MVVDRRTDLVLHALADGTRRDIVQRVLTGAGGESVSALARRYPISLTAVQKHVAALEAAGIVRKERRGREQLVHVDVDAIRGAAEVLERLAALEATWRGRIDRIGEVLADEPRRRRT